MATSVPPSDREVYSSPTWSQLHESSQHERGRLHDQIIGKSNKELSDLHRLTTDSKLREAIEDLITRRERAAATEPHTP